jgi:mRNA-degrading endonuclease YafQ of YafQ-DinJ toxin-antitoxin module
MIYRSSHFKRQLRKLSPKLQRKVAERLRLMLVNEFDPILNNHKLGGEYEGDRSINITGDIRLTYKRERDDFYLRVVGTHSQLYK